MYKDGRLFSGSETLKVEVTPKPAGASSIGMKGEADKIEPLGAIITKPYSDNIFVRRNFTFRGIVEGAEARGGVKDVWVRVIDWARKIRTVHTKARYFNEDKTKWYFRVKGIGIPDPHVTPGSKAKLKVRVQGNDGTWSEWEDILIKVMSNPTIAITYPVKNRVTVPKQGFRFEGKPVWNVNSSDISMIHVSVWDYTRKEYTVRNEIANYNALTRKWYYNIRPEHMTPGGKLQIKARAKNTTYWWCDWKMRKVFVSE